MLLVLGFGYGCFVCLLRYVFGRRCVFVWVDLAGGGVLIMCGCWLIDVVAVVCYGCWVCYCGVLSCWWLVNSVVVILMLWFVLIL